MTVYKVGDIVHVDDMDRTVMDISKGPLGKILHMVDGSEFYATSCSLVLRPGYERPDEPLDRAMTWHEFLAEIDDMKARVKHLEEEPKIDPAELVERIERLEYEIRYLRQDLDAANEQINSLEGRLA